VFDDDCVGYFRERWLDGFLEVIPDRGYTEGAILITRFGLITKTMLDTLTKCGIIVGFPKGGLPSKDLTHISLIDLLENTKHLIFQDDSH
jgi:hypothetical protein